MDFRNQSLKIIKRICLPFLSAAVLLLVLFLLFPQPVQAATLVVYNSSDAIPPVPGSLRWAIEQANLTTVADTIVFSTSVDTVPIILSGAAGEDANATGDLDILNAGGDLTIMGNGATNTIIDGNGNDRVLHICPGGGCTNTITITGVTIQNGSIPGGTGGGIYNTAGTATLYDCTVSTNTAHDGGGITNEATLNVMSSTIGGSGVGNTGLYGGGIYNKAGTTTVDGSTISANEATLFGGGIYNMVTLYVQNSSIVAGNTATNDGGGIYNAFGTTTVDSSTVNSNTANNGGGIYNNTGTLFIQNNSSIGEIGVGNTADDDGGGIFNHLGGTITVTASTIISNTARFGGGIFNSADSTVTVDGSDVSANSAFNGGGIYNLNSLIIQNGSTIGGAGVGNAANAYGGGIYNQEATTTVDNSTISANSAFNSGGGIFNYEGTVNIQQNSLVGGVGAGNSATSEGGGIFNLLGTTTVDNSTVSVNNAPDGAGIFNGGDEGKPSTLIIQNDSIIGGPGAGNTATVNGGGLYNGELGVTTVTSSTVSANTASDGGGIYNEAGVTIQGGSIIGGDGGANTAANGGGIYNYDGTTKLDGSTVISNTASTHGGGIFNDATLSIKNGSAVNANTATSNGGGIYHSGTLSITNSTIGGIGFGNTAGNYGGGIYNVIGITTVDDSNISGNVADYGGGIYNWITLIIRNNSLIGGEGSGNIAVYEGGGIYNAGGTSTITNSRITYNTASNGGGLFEITGVAEATNMKGSCFVGNSDTSFFNNLSAAQVATGNWWGSINGPNTSGADTVAGTVDTSGYLSAPILGCKIYVYLPVIMR